MRNSTQKLIAEYERRIALMRQEDDATEFEVKYRTETTWREASAPEWHFDEAEYRVKPKPFEGWIWKYPNGTFGTVTYACKQTNITGEAGRVMIFLREVTE